MNRYCVILLLLIGPLSFAQGVFEFPLGTTSDKIPVEIVNNLVIVPVTVNGTELKFLLDTGADATIIFQIEKDGSLAINDASYATVTGAGNGTPTKALKSYGNTIQIGKAQSADEPILLILDEAIDFSPQLGIAVQGIIGYQVFKDFIIELNYIKNYIRLHNPNSYTYKDCTDCVSFPLEVTKNKAFINANLDLMSASQEIKLLLDSGMGDALWLLEKSDHSIAVPEKQFEDFLGLGLNGPIYGNRAKSKSLKLGKWKLSDIATAFPDSASTRNIQNKEQRNGSLGAEVLKRFHSIIDYRNKRLTLSKNRNYGSPFYYNKSGLSIQHGGYTIARKLVSSNDDNLSLANEYTNQIVELFRDTNRYRKVLEPTYEIIEVRPNSPAANAGVQTGDYIISINNTFTKKLSLKEINEHFFQEDGKKITLIVERNGERLRFSFQLEALL